jgi:drug/metabolite transporter (DMT)-like permease
MSATVFLAVLAAALMHAGWNVLVKRDLDRFAALFLLQSLMGIIGAGMLMAFGMPAAPSFAFALTSGLLHTGYNICLARSYRDGDLSQVYPIARGMAPLLTLISTIALTADALLPLTMIGIAVLIAGIWLIAVEPAKVKRLDRQSLLFALGTSIFIAAYTIVDGLGGRASDNTAGYAGFVFLLDALFLTAYALWRRGMPVFGVFSKSWRSGMLGAILSAAAYWIAIWAMAHAPIAAVAALRETSIIFVVLLSARFLKEEMAWTRYAGGAMVVAGAALMRAA